MTQPELNIFCEQRKPEEIHAEISSLERILGSYQALLANREAGDPELTRDYIRSFRKRIDALKAMLQDKECSQPGSNLLK